MSGSKKKEMQPIANTNILNKNNIVQNIYNTATIQYIHNTTGEKGIIHHISAYQPIPNI